MRLLTRTKGHAAGRKPYSIHLGSVVAAPILIFCAGCGGSDPVAAPTTASASGGLPSTTAASVPASTPAQTPTPSSTSSSSPTPQGTPLDASVTVNDQDGYSYDLTYHVVVASSSS